MLDLPPTALHAVEEEAFLGLHTLEKHFFSIQGIFLFKRGKVILLLGLWKSDYLQTQPVLLLRGYLVVPSKGSLFIHSLFRISTSSFQDKGSGNVLPSFIKLFLIGMVRSINLLTACASSLLGSIQGKVLISAWLFFDSPAISSSFWLSKILESTFYFFFALNLSEWCRWISGHCPIEVELLLSRTFKLFFRVLAL